MSILISWLGPIVTFLQAIFTPDSTNPDEITKLLHINSLACFMEVPPHFNPDKNVVAEVMAIYPNGNREVRIYEYPSRAYPYSEYRVEFRTKKDTIDTFDMTFLNYRKGDRNFKEGDTKAVRFCNMASDGGPESK